MSDTTRFQLSNSLQNKLNQLDEGLVVEFTDDEAALLGAFTDETLPETEFNRALRAAAGGGE